MSGPPVYHHYSPATQRSTEIVEDEDGLTFVHSQNVKPIVEQCKREAAAFDPLVRRDTVKVASIPLVIWRQLQRLGITNDEKALNAWLDNRDNRVFRTDDGRKL